MALYFDTIDLPVSEAEAFHCLAEFGQIAAWDPGVVRGARLTEGEIRVGSRFRVILSFLGRHIPLEYRIAEFEPTSRIVLSGRGSSLRSLDEITFESRGGGTRVTDEARLEPLDDRRVAEPMLDLIFQRIGSMAIRGLRERLAARGFERSSETRGFDAMPQSSSRGRESARFAGKVRPNPRNEGVST